MSKDTNDQAVLEPDALTELLTSRKIMFNLSTDHAGTRFFMVQRRDVFALLMFVKTLPDEAYRLLEAPGETEDGADTRFLRAHGVEFPQMAATVLFCETLDDGRWVSRYRDAPISRAYPPRQPGGEFARGRFISYRGIGYVPEGVQERLTNQFVPATPDPVDVVYTWVDASDVRWRIKRALYSEKRKEGDLASRSADHDLRYVSRDELKYSIRSVRKHAPWVRNIFIVTDEQVPTFIDPDDRVTIVDHRDIFPDPSVLPVFNSHAIEACLHRIEGLSEFFIYFNDDVFLGRPVERSHFFDDQGRTVTYISQASFIDPSMPRELCVPTDLVALNMQSMFLRDFGFMPTRKMMHTPHPLRRSILQEIARRYKTEVALTRKSRIRSETDLSIASMFFQYYSWATSRSVLREPGSTTYTYFDTGKSDLPDVIDRIRKKPPHFFCANATYFEEIPIDEQAELRLDLFESLYPA